MSKEFTLACCCEFQEGYVNPSQKVPKYFGGNIKWLRASDLHDGHVFNTERSLSEAGYKSAGKSAKMFEKDTLVISKSGTIGSLGILKDKMCGNRAVINISVNSDFADLMYVFYTLKYKKSELIGRAGGSIQKNLYVSALETLVLNHEILSEQKKIAAVLSSLDDKIDCNNRINAELEAMAKTLYDYWFVQFDFPDANGKPYKSSGGKMVYNPTYKREIPAGWEVWSLNNLVKVVKGNVSPSDIDASTPYIGLEHIGRKTIVLSNWATSDLANSDKTAFKKDDILFGKIRPYFHKVAAAPFDGITSTDTIILRPKKKSFLGLALETVFSDEFIESATQSSTGSKMPRADWSVLQHYKIPVPKTDLLEAYQSSFEGVLKKTYLSSIENKKLSDLRDWLLPMLMNGQVPVN